MRSPAHSGHREAAAPCSQSGGIFTGLPLQIEIVETEGESVLGRKSASLSVPKFNFVGLAAGL